MRTVWNFNSAGQIIFGRHAVDRLSEIAGRLQARRALVVTDAPLVAAGVLDRVRGPLLQAGAAVEVFDGGCPEPPMEVAESCRAMAADVQPDLLVGLGGGSNMDLAKITAALITHGGDPRDYMGDDNIPGPVHPLVCVPTTSGTGSEVSAASVLTDTQQQMKIGILSNFLRPLAAVVDPLLTVSCPPHVTAHSGIDALTHAIEAYTAVDN